MKKLIAFVLCLAIIMSAFVSAFAADTASGTTLRLTKTEGTVTVKKSSGKSVSFRSNMQLQSGYTVKTAKKSYAYISLDGSKAVKMDASSEVQIMKSGKKLEIIILSGKIFCDVSEKLDSDESLNIRTSTMVTGIHGTSLEGTVDTVKLLSGKTVSTLINSNGSSQKSYELNAGEMLQVPAQETTKQVSNKSTEEVGKAVQEAASNEEGSSMLKDRVDNLVQSEGSGDRSSINNGVDEVIISKIENPMTVLGGFTLLALAESTDTVKRIKIDAPKLAEELEELDKTVAESVLKADEILNEIFVSAESPTYADGTKNDLQVETPIVETVDVTKALNVDQIKIESKKDSSDTTNNTIVTPPEEPQNDPEPYVAPTYSVTLPKDIVGVIDPDVSTASTTIVAFRAVSGTALTGISAGGKVVIAVDYNDSAYANVGGDYTQMYSVLLFDSRNTDSKLTAVSTGITDPNLPGFTSEYYVIDNINSNIDIPIQVHASQAVKNIDVLLSLLEQDEDIHLKIDTPCTISGITVGSAQTVEFFSNVTFAGTNVNNGNIYVFCSNASINTGDKFINNNTLTFGDEVNTTVLGELINNGTVTSFSDDSSYTIDNLSNTIINAGIFNIGAGTTLNNGASGDNIPAKIINSPSGIINIDGTNDVNNYGDFINYGTININEAAFKNYGTITDSGVIHITSCYEDEEGFYYRVSVGDGAFEGSYTGPYSLKVIDARATATDLLGGIPSSVWYGYEPYDDKGYGDWLTENLTELPATKYDWVVNENYGLEYFNDGITADTVVEIKEKDKYTITLPESIMKDNVTLASFRLVSGAATQIDGNLNTWTMDNPGGTAIIAVDILKSQNISGATMDGYKTALYDSRDIDAQSNDDTVEVNPLSSVEQDETTGNTSLGSEYRTSYYAIEINQDVDITLRLELVSDENKESSYLPYLTKESDNKEGVLICCECTLPSLELDASLNLWICNSVNVTNPLTNLGVVQIGSDATVTVLGTINNKGTIDNEGSLIVADGGTLNNESEAFIDNGRSISVLNGGKINNNGDIALAQTGSIANAGTIDNEGDITVISVVEVATSTDITGKMFAEEYATDDNPHMLTLTVGSNTLTPVSSNITTVSAVIQKSDYTINAVTISVTEKDGNYIIDVPVPSEDKSLGSISILVNYDMSDVF